MQSHSFVCITTKSEQIVLKTYIILTETRTNNFNSIGINRQNVTIDELLNILRVVCFSQV